MTLTSQFDILEREHIRKAGKPVVLRVQSVKTIDYTSPKGTITRDSYEQSMLAVAGDEVQVSNGFTRTFRCLASDLPTYPSTEFKVVHEGLVYKVERFTTGRVAVVLHCSRA